MTSVAPGSRSGAGAEPEDEGDADAPDLLSDPAVRGVLKGTGSPPQLTRELCLHLLRQMILLRIFDERAVAYQRQGRLGTYPTYWGEEAIQAGAVAAAAPDDWLFPSYRQAALGILRGQDPADYLRIWRGDGRGLRGPREHRVAPLTVPISTHLPHAVGVAWAARLRGDRVASMAFFGDGATSEGDFHEAMNLAAVLRAGTVFVCTNNQWAISTPVTRQTAVRALAEKASAYGVPAVRVDGFDVLAVHTVCAEAFERAHRGDGPTLVEAVCYRIGPHGTADDPSLYRDEETADRWRRMEPVGRYRRWLEANGLYEEGFEERCREEARALIGARMAEVEADSPPPARMLVDTVYASVPQVIERALAAMLADRDAAAQPR